MGERVWPASYYNVVPLDAKSRKKVAATIPHQSSHPLGKSSQGGQKDFPIRHTTWKNDRTSHSVPVIQNPIFEFKSHKILEDIEFLCNDALTENLLCLATIKRSHSMDQG